ncbi:hypothetical protein HUZ36_14100 [Pseudoalteromonas sp. McH1-7]|uniref:hypothetical protein n=1 Tax=unclassified Pseudoalteromonas TaxID=194690 RepID=UPI000F64B4EE|nr:MULTISPECIES: hypothetical protein [unclassified Pseudoalteromonas]NUZ11916.1 hypothetical protein [Pseudoalteromonas sp. McH1-7]RRS09106.1 hypothetical protein EAG18_08275 [Pseudoalteromonas sp. J010]
MYHQFKHGLVDLAQVLDFLIESTSMYFTYKKMENGRVLNLMPRVTLDANAKDQPWVVRFELINDIALRMNIVTPMQLDPDGSLYNRNLGSLNTKDTSYAVGYWHQREGLKGDAKYSRPFSVLFTADSHGFAFAIWEHAVVNSLNRQLSWLVVQKPVEWQNGIAIPTEHNPVIALSGIFNRYESSVEQMLVRERDIPVPAPAQTAISDQYNRYSAMHTVKLKEISESRDYFIQFPNNFSTERFSYDGVFDMIGFANTDLVSANATLPLEVFGERRNYHTMVSTLADNNGVSVMFRIT